MRTDSLEPILRGVKTLLRGRETVALPEQGLDLLFDEGVVARCRVCDLCWEVKRSQFKAPGWWTCPSGCRTHMASGARDADRSCSV